MNREKIVVLVKKWQQIGKEKEEKEKEPEPESHE